MRLRFSRRAEADLEEIAAFIARDHPVRAVSFVRKLREECLRLLARFPKRRGCVPSWARECA